MLRAALALALILPAPALLAAQQHPLVGTWAVSYAAGIRMDASGPTAVMGSGTVTISVQGDSLIGELAAEATPDRPARPPVRFATRAAPSGELTFLSRSEAVLNLNGAEQRAPVITTWKLAVRSDSLVGTMERVIEGMDMANAGPQPITGVRR